MKKMIMAAAIVCAATFVHAAACEWSLTGIQSSDKTEAKAGSMVAYFMEGSTFDAFTALGGAEVGKYAVANSLSSAKIQTSRTGASASGTFGTFSPGDQLSGYIVLFDSDTAESASSYAMTGVSTKDVPSAGNVKFAMAFGTDTVAKGWATIPGGSTPGGVPEPTSGLLLVLGGAALALRRRR